MTARAARFIQPPTKANRFAWAGCWVRHRRPFSSLHYRLSRLRTAVCAAPPAQASEAAAANHNDTQTT